MLIKSLKATNFMKYKLLELNNLPEEGAIGIFGENESGKSTIGEAFSFALFGQTSKYSEDELYQLIHWEGDESEVSLCFVIPEKGEYTINRYINRRGTLKAVLCKEGSEKAIRTGFYPVTQRISQLIGFDFESFRYTFYLAQKELDILKKDYPSNSRTILYRMLGIDRLKNARKLAKEEFEQINAKKNRCDSELAATRAMLEDIKKVDKATEKEKHEELKLSEQDKNKAKEKIEKLEKELEKTQKIYEVRKDIDNVWLEVEKAFNCELQRTILSARLFELSQIHTLLREERARLLKNVEGDKGSLEEKQKKGLRIADLKEKLRDLAEMVGFHHGKLKKRLEPPPLKAEPVKEAFSENLPENLRNTEGQLGRIKHIQLFLWITAGFWGVLFILFFILGINASIIGLSDLIWVFWSLDFLFILLCAGSAVLTIFLIRRRLEELIKRKRSIEKEIASLENEIEICRSFQTKQFRRMKSDVLSLSDEQIHRKLDIIEREFPEFLEEIDALETITERHTKSETQQKRDVEEATSRHVRIDNLAKLIEGLGKDLDLTAPPIKDGADLLKDMNVLEKKIYSSLEGIQHNRVSIKEYEGRGVLEIDLAWKNFDNLRNHFRELTQISTGTGILAKLQNAFKQKDETALSDILSQERETFFSILPTVKSMEEKTVDMKKDLEATKRSLNEFVSKAQILTDEYQRYQGMVKHKEELLVKLNALNEQLKEQEHSIQVYGFTIDFLEETENESKSRFGPSISKIIENVLPRITKDRYRHIQVSEDLDIKVFSNEKGDFVELEELSGGTIDQILLSLRLAFSQAMVYARAGKNYQQFLFFDEPFSSFDEERSISFLDLISDYSRNFAQIFVSSPRRYPDESFDLLIKTSLGEQSLTVNSGKIEKGKKLKSIKEYEEEKGKSSDKEDEAEKNKEEKEDIEEIDDEPEDDIHIEYDENGGI